MAFRHFLVGESEVGQEPRMTEPFVRPDVRQFLDFLNGLPGPKGYEAGPDGLEIFVIGAPNLGEDPRGDVEGRRDWWTD